MSDEAWSDEAWSDEFQSEGGLAGRTSMEPRLAARARSRIVDRDGAIDLSLLAAGTCLNGAARRLAGRAVLVATHSQMAGAAAIVELDGLVRRFVIAPPGLTREHVASICEDAAIEAVVTDHPERHADLGLEVVAIGAVRACASAPPRPYDTEWVLLTSGTSGRPKMVAHTLAALVGAIAGKPPGHGTTIWATFYDIRRYGGLQILLRAILGGCTLVLTSEDEPLGDHLRRLSAAGITAISGTPSHWRRVLMSQDRRAISPRYVRLSGEIADQVVLDGLRSAYPGATIGHAYASTEAGVGFAVEDGLEGFPARLLETPVGGLEMKIVDGSLHIRSRRAALRYVGPGAASLLDSDGFVDSGDIVERRGARYHFVGRRGGIINVGGLKVNPEEVEAALNSHSAVRMSLVRARKNPLTGAIVVADVVLSRPVDDDETTKHDILETCRACLDRHKVPAMIRFVEHLALTPGGKLSRANG